MSRIISLLEQLINSTTIDSPSVSPSVSPGDHRIDERVMSPYHKEKIAIAHRGNRQSQETRRKISKSMQGKSNFEGKRHTDHARDVIGAKRGSADRIKGRRWIVNSSQKTYRRYHAPGGYKIGRRKFSVTESLLSFKDFVDE